MDASRYPGRDSNPHATKAVALKETVSDQFHHPGEARNASGSRRNIPGEARATTAAGSEMLRDGSELTVD